MASRGPRACLPRGGPGTRGEARRRRSPRCRGPGMERWPVARPQTRRRASVLGESGAGAARPLWNTRSRRPRRRAARGRLSRARSGPRRVTAVGDRERQGLGPSGARRRLLPHRDQVGGLSQRGGRAQVRRGQRRGGRAGHLQGSPPDGGRSPPARRGHAPRRVRVGSEPRHPLRPRRGRSLGGAAGAGGGRGRGRRDRRRSDPRPRISPVASSCAAAPGASSWARKPRSSSRSRGAGLSRAPARPFPSSPASGAGPP